MFVSNPFSELAAYLPALVVQVYVVLMIAAVAVGTLLDTYHKGSAEFFARRKAKAKAAARRRLGGLETASLAAKTLAEAAVSGEFNKWPRRVSHLLMMYGFLLYVIATAALVFADSAAAPTPVILPTLWTVGALMIVAGGAWFFFFLRVNVAHDGDSPFHLGRADLFVGSLIASAAFGLLWHFVQTLSDHAVAILIFFGLYVFFTTLLFGSVFWSKFAHMFYKPVVAFQRRVEEANGSSDLPAPVGGRDSRR